MLIKISFLGVSLQNFFLKYTTIFCILLKVNQVVETALDAMIALTQADLAAVRSIKSPTATLRLNLEVMCLYKNIKPDRIPDPSGGGGTYLHHDNLLTSFGKVNRLKF